MTKTRWVPRAAVGLAALLAALAAGFGTAAAHAPVIGVVPNAVAGSLAPGASMNVTKTVHTTEIPPLVDILLLEDETFSFVDDIANLQALAAPGGPLITELDDTGADYATGVAGFRDFAQFPWGDPGDWVYRRPADITPSAISPATRAAGRATPPRPAPARSRPSSPVRTSQSSASRRAARERSRASTRSRPGPAARFTRPPLPERTSSRRSWRASATCRLPLRRPGCEIPTSPSCSRPRARWSRAETTRSSSRRSQRTRRRR